MGQQSHAIGQPTTLPLQPNRGCSSGARADFPFAESLSAAKISLPCLSLPSQVPWAFWASPSYPFQQMRGFECTGHHGLHALVRWALDDEPNSSSLQVVEGHLSVPAARFKGNLSIGRARHWAGGIRKATLSRGWVESAGLTGSLQAPTTSNTRLSQTRDLQQAQ